MVQEITGPPLVRAAKKWSALFVGIGIVGVVAFGAAAEHLGDAANDSVLMDLIVAGLVANVLASAIFVYRYGKSTGKGGAPWVFGILVVPWLLFPVWYFVAGPGNNAPTAAMASETPNSLGMPPPVDGPATQLCPSCRTPMHWTAGGFLKWAKYSCTQCRAKLTKAGQDRLSLGITASTPTNLRERFGSKPLTREEWLRVGRGGLSDEEQLRDDIANWLAALPASGPELIDSSIHGIPLQTGETVLASASGVKLSEPRAQAKSSGSTGGISFRVAKGVTLRTGGYSGTTESSEFLKEVDHGDFVLTTSRIVFVGGLRTVSIPFTKLVSIRGDPDKIVVGRAGKERQHVFSGLSRRLVPLRRDDQVLGHHGLFVPATLAMIELTRTGNLDLSDSDEAYSEANVDQSFPPPGAM